MIKNNHQRQAVVVGNAEWCNVTNLKWQDVASDVMLSIFNRLQLPEFFIFMWKH
jgi:hypothetical protein